MKKFLFGKRAAGLLLAGAMVLLAAGCNNTAETNEGTSQGQDGKTPAASDSKEAEEGSTAMGRYVEETTDLSEYCIRPFGITQTLDGSLLINDAYMGQILSEDNGITWNSNAADWFTPLQQDQAYIMDVKVGADGTIGLIYNLAYEDSDSGQETGDGQDTQQTADDETAGTEEAAEADDETAEEADEEVTEDDSRLDPKCVIIKPDGTRIEAQLTLTNPEAYPVRIWFSQEGRIFVTVIRENTIYEIKEDGSAEKFLTLEYYPDLIQFQGNYMIMDSFLYANGPLIYDLEKEEYFEDEVLSSFVKENYPKRDSNGGTWFDFYFFPGEEDVLYLAGKEGLHRHVIGGSAIEQIIDGNLSNFSNPANGICGMVMLENNEFLTLFTGGMLARYTYNPDIPTTPSEKLSVYSLKENDTLRQTITIFQKQNPDVLVHYEAGMEDGGAVTREDALKKLNTQIMAGEGPDLLLLDQMPMDSYISKGMLLDLSDCLADFTKETELFPNIVSAFTEDGSIYALPCEIQLPVVLGKEAYATQMTDLVKTADAMEALRRENPEGGLIDLYSERTIMSLFARTSAPSWKTENGEINQASISEFLEQTKRIYDAQMQGASEKEIQREQEVNAFYLQNGGIPIEETEYFVGMDGLSYIGGKSNIVIGAITYPYGYAELTSVDRVKGFEDTVLLPLGGQSSDVFLAKTMMGINATSANIEAAQEFLKTMLGEENQTSLFYGFPVNKAAFDEVFKPNEANLAEDGSYGKVAMSDTDGLYIELTIYFPDEEKLQAVKDWMSTAKTPYIKDVILEDAVLTAGTEYFQGSISLEQAVDNIVAKLAIYMAE